MASLPLEPRSRLRSGMLQDFRRVLDNVAPPLEVAVLKPAQARAVVLFAVGGGGNPDRHLPFLEALAADGCIIVAPRFPRLASPFPSAAELVMRTRRLQLALDDIAEPHLPITGVGHSIGATTLLIAAGAQASTLAGEVVQLSPDSRLQRLLLLAPATDFFRAPGALGQVRALITAWTGSADEITPPASAEILRTASAGEATVELRICTGAGHFSFMNTPPPHAAEPLGDRDAFLRQIADEVAGFVCV